MNVKTMLARFETALGCHNLAEEMVLLPAPNLPISSNKNQSAKSVNFIVGYNSSPKSQIALDITLWIAHQTRLVTTQEVTVQVVYVLDESQDSYCEDICNFAEGNFSAGDFRLSDANSLSAFNCAAPAIAFPPARIESISPRTTWIDSLYLQAIFCQQDRYEIADKLLWQARCLAQEWRGLFKAHLRIGSVAAELRNVVALESANVLFLGCNSVNHPLVKQLGTNFPCCVLGIPAALSSPIDLHPEDNSTKLECATAIGSV